jgi:histidyl-tRNA synthetase
MMKAMIQGVKGARDFYPEEMAYRTWIYGKLASVSNTFGYQEYDGPFLERLELYAAKSGDELVKEQSFVFADRGGDMITLRPELTPSLARMIAQKQNELVFPVRWWSFGPFWRYERPQKGRSREFFQWNIDLIGPNSPEADAEMISIGASFLKTAGLRPDQVKIYVNNRKLMEAEVLALGIAPEKQKSVFRIIDRKDKLNAAAWRAFAIEEGLTDTQVDGLEALLGNKDLWKKSPDLVRTFNLLALAGLDEYAAYDPNIIRGLEYYTGTVFEARDCDGEFRAILGGGRYNNLVGDVGGQPVGGLGFAMGDVVIKLVLQKFGCLPDFKMQPANVMVTVFDETTADASFGLGVKLREGGIAATSYPEIAKLPKQFKYADRVGIRWILVIGPDELAQGNVTVKDLKDGSQSVMPVEEVVEFLKTLMTA